MKLNNNEENDNSGDLSKKYRKFLIMKKTIDNYIFQH